MRALFHSSAHFIPSPVNAAATTRAVMISRVCGAGQRAVRGARITSCYPGAERCRRGAGQRTCSACSQQLSAPTASHLVQPVQLQGLATELQAQSKDLQEKGGDIRAGLYPILQPSKGTRPSLPTGALAPEHMQGLQPHRLGCCRLHLAHARHGSIPWQPRGDL